MSDINGPEVRILAVSNVYCRLMNFAKAGDVELGHYHEYDHGTLLAKGRLQVEMFDMEDNLVSTKEFVAPTFIMIRKNNTHRLTALEDGTVATCIHALRTIEDEIVDPDFIIDNQPISETSNGAHPTMRDIFADKGMVYKQMASPTPFNK
jgi:hypothetical protein